MSEDSLTNEVIGALRDAGTALKADLWKSDDEAFLAARAADLIGLHAKASEAADDNKRRAYVAAAADVLNHVKLLALIRMEVGAQHLVDLLGQFFLEKAVPVLLTLLPKLVGIV